MSDSENGHHRHLQRGDVWTVWFDPVVGHEQGGPRPALVISSDLLHAIPSALAFVVPITTRDRGVRSHVPILPPEGGLTMPSFAMTEQVRAVSRLRCRRRLGAVSQETTTAVVRRILLFLGV